MIVSTDSIAGVPREGELVADKYRIGSVIGIGGMGVVVAAIHEGLGERVAIKFLGEQACQDSERVARFIREAWIASKIKNDHVARVVDVGTLAGGHVFMAMEYLEGEELSVWIARQRFDIDMAVDFVLQVLEAIAEAHRLGIIHRDLKPANLFVTRRADGSPWLKVLDFGISKVTASSGELTKTSAMLGSPLYMAPEQLLASKDADMRADIWALGVILYELLGNSTPFSGESLASICTQVLHAPAPSLVERRPDIPPEIAAAVARCLSKSPDDRFRDVAELAAALAPFGGPGASMSAEYVRRVMAAPAPAPRAPLPSSGGSKGPGYDSLTELMPQDTVPAAPNGPVTVPSPLLPTPRDAAALASAAPDGRGAMASQPVTAPGMPPPDALRAPAYIGGGTLTDSPIWTPWKRPNRGSTMLAAGIAVGTLAVVSVVIGYAALSDSASSAQAEEPNAPPAASLERQQLEDEPVDSDALRDDGDAVADQSEAPSALPSTSAAAPSSSATTSSPAAPRRARTATGERGRAPAPAPSTAPSSRSGAFRKW
jgi:serine/threonine-protein kinase